MNSSDAIDFVIPWVDGSDPAWQQEKALYSNKKTTMVGSQGDKITRFQDWGLLRYWFRGVENFAPWVRKIHFVTWGHTPKWLNLEHPKLHIVNHRDYMPEEYLPTFSSHAIELNFHRIPDLAEQFVYFNDDMYLLKETQPHDFFKNGLPCMFACLVPYRVLKDDWRYFPLNNIALINEHFSIRESIGKNLGKWFNPKYGKNNFITILMAPFPAFYGFYEQHLPTSFLKSTFETVWNEEYEMLDATSKQKFRYYLNVQQWLIEDWQLVSGNFYPRSPKFGQAFYLSGENETNLANLCRYIEQQKGKSTCVNDGDLNPAQTERAQEAVKQAFETILPSRSQFELF